MKYTLTAHLNSGKYQQLFKDFYDAYAKVKELQKLGVNIKSYSIDKYV